MNLQLAGKVTIITGASQGLGLAIAEKFFSEGASLALCARDQVLMEKVGNSFQERALPSQKIFWHCMDVSNNDNTKEFVEDALKRFGTLDVLVNNAGIYGPKGNVETVDWESWVRTIEVNLLGSILMAREVLPIFKSKKKGKIIQLSGGGATNPMPNLSAYAVSKAAIVRFVETLAEEVREFKIDVNAIAPGPLNTRLLDEILEAGPEKVGRSFFKNALKQQEEGGAPLDAGSSLALFLASEQSNGITGKLISALWDKWGSWPEHVGELNKSDAYTLRRITGRDRGLHWGDK